MTPPTGKSCFVFVFALRACVSDATRDQGVSRRVFVALLLLRPPGPDTVKPMYFHCLTTSTFENEGLAVICPQYRLLCNACFKHNTC